MGEKEKRTSKKNVDGKRTSSHDNKKLRTRSMEKERGSVMFSFCRLLKFPLTFYYKLTSHDSSVDIETGYRFTNRIVTAGLWSPMSWCLVNWRTDTVSTFRRHLQPPPSQQKCGVDQFVSQKFYEPAASIVRVRRSVDKYQSFERTVSSIISIFPTKASNLLNPTLHATRFASPPPSSDIKVHNFPLGF